MTTDATGQQTEPQLWIARDADGCAWTCESQPHWSEEFNQWRLGENLKLIGHHLPQSLIANRTAAPLMLDRSRLVRATVANARTAFCGETASSG